LQDAGGSPSVFSRSSLALALLLQLLLLPV